MSYYYPPANLTTFFNHFWKKRLMDDMSKCSNLPHFHQWETPLKRKQFMLFRCYLTTTDFKMKNPEPLQKLEINVKKGQELISKVVVYLEGLRYTLSAYDGYPNFY